MKISLVSSAVSSASIKADRPQQLKSVTVYWRGRKMVLMQRPQRRLSVLLCRMLRRSMQSLFGTLIGTLANKGKRAIGTAALATGALASMSAYAGITDITLPVNGTVQSGTAAISTVGNQMTVTQATDKAIIDWQSFSIGSKAGVNFIQNNANSVALNRVTGNDPSLIMGSLTANGKLFLVNAAGILVGKNAKIDVAGFVASTLNISNADFLAGKMNFAAEAGKHIGNVKNKGEITVHDGGSVYLIGANVENDGIINAPNGEVLLAAGRTVKLIDTTLPGVSIDVGGIAGKVTNLGRIMASAGTVGIGAALIDNSGTINASSVTKEGGRIFLRASQDLTTSSTSMINADGTVGGNVVLYADHSANIDGDVSALGNVDGNGGKGGYVDTSGKRILNVKYVPRVGPGGEWFIDPHDVEIVSDSVTPVGTSGTSAITADGDSAKIRASTIAGQLNNNVSVSISTGTGGTEAGDITVSSAIHKTAGNLATLTLDAAGSIVINDAISSGGDSAGMNLVLSAHNGSISQTAALTVGDLTASAGTAITLNNASNQIGALTANAAGDISVTSMGGSAITLNNINATNGNIAIVNINNDIHLVGNLTANGTGKGIALTAGAGMLQTGGVISTGQLTANVGIDMDLQSAGNSIASFTGTTPGGHIYLNNTGDLATFGHITVGEGKAVNLSTIGNLTVGGMGIDAQTINLSAAAPNASVPVNIAINGQLTATGAISLHTANGTITQTAAISAASLNAIAGAGITLANASNVMTGFSGSNGISGNIVLKNSGTQQLILGPIDNNNGGGITIHSGGDININGRLTVGATTGTVTLDSANGISESYGIGITAGTVDATAHNGSIILDQANFNQIGLFKGDSSGSGDYGNINVSNTGDLHLGTVRADGSITVQTVGQLTVDANAMVTAQAINLTTKALGTEIQTDYEGGEGDGKPTPVVADMTITGSLTATGVTLRSDGAITQGTSAGAGIVASTLNATALHGITLNSGNNTIAAFSARNGVNGYVDIDTVISGDIALTTLGALTLSGDVINSASTGNVRIVADGNIVSTSNHGDGGINRTSSNGTVTLTSTTGNVTLGRIDAVDLTVNAHGLINQEPADTGGLTVTGTMSASARTGITLNHSNVTCGTNHIANFSATNNTSGDITLINVSTEDTVNNLVQITNSGGSISVDNTGAMKTTGLISAPHGTVALHTHSPLTIGAGGINAGNGVTLTAGDGTSASDALTLNGVIQTTLGNLTFGGNSVTPNAPIFGPNAPVFNSTTPVVPGPNFAFNPVTVVTSTPPPPVVVTNTTVDQNVASTSNVSGNLTDAVVPTTSNQQNTTSSLSNQTAGGGDGEFGGSKDDGKERNTKSNKPLPVCS
jgi:filamentous hemagglutinin family protein